MKAIVITIFIFCSLIDSTFSAANGSTTAAPDPCLDIKNDCDKCTSTKGCAFWFCGTADLKPTNVTLCESTHDSKPKSNCTYGGKWHKVEQLKNCPTNGSTTTTTTTTTTNTNTNTNTDITITTITTITSTTIKPITTTSSGNPHTDTGEKLTVWTIVGIVVSSLLVVIILVLVAWKKVRRLYQMRNPYHTLQE